VGAQGQYQLVVCVRFLERAFLGQVPGLLAPGGLVLYSTFVDGPGTRAFGRPAGAEQPGEPSSRARHFGPAQGFRVVRDEVAPLPDGREVCMFVA
jgi:hypothetical protein